MTFERILISYLYMNFSKLRYIGNDEVQMKAQVNCEPIGYVLNRGPVTTKSPIYSYYRLDCAHKNNYPLYMVLCKWFDGSGVWFRYRINDIVFTNNR